MINNQEIKPFIQSKLFFAVFSCFLFFFLIIDLCFLTPVSIAQIFIPNVELKVPLRKSTKEAKAEMQIHTLTKGYKGKGFNVIRKGSM